MSLISALTKVNRAEVLPGAAELGIFFDGDLISRGRLVQFFLLEINVGQGEIEHGARRFIPVFLEHAGGFVHPVVRDELEHFQHLVALGGGDARLDLGFGHVAIGELPLEGRIVPYRQLPIAQPGIPGRSL